MVQLSLYNGMKMPCIGLGTWQIRDRGLLSELLREAYTIGYRLIDTAAAYGNEIGIAKAIESNGLHRDEIILSDKVWNTCRGYEEVQTACRNSLKKLKTDYLDLYLIHWPASPRLHPDWERINAEYCKAHDILIQASSPLGNGEILSNDELMKLAKEKGKSAAQISLRWELQKGVAAIPKTTNFGRLAENIDLFDFQLNEEEMKRIDKIPYCGGLGIDSDEVTEFG